MGDAKTPEPLLTAQFIIALCGLVILALTLTGVFLIKDLSPLQGTIAGAVVSGIMGSIMQFFFGSSKSSQGKDDLIASKIPNPAPVAAAPAPVVPPLVAAP